MPEIEPVGEFGSLEWCVACAEGGVKILKEAELPPDLEWGFSEIYTHPPERLLPNGREMSAYYIMVKNGEVTGGDGAPEECRALPGFHIKIQWASICNQSQSLPKSCRWPYSRSLLSYISWVSLSACSICLAGSDIELSQRGRHSPACLRSRWQSLLKRI